MRNETYVSNISESIVGGNEGPQDRAGGGGNLFPGDSILRSQVRAHGRCLR